MRIAVLSFLLAGATGYAVARFAGGKPEVAGRLPSAGGVNAEKRSRVERWEGSDLTAWAIRNPGYSGAADDGWEEWSEEELRRALDDGVRDPDWVQRPSSSGDVIRGMFGEWLRRNPDRALEWFESLVSDTMKHHLGSTLAMNWPKNRRSDGLKFVIDHRDVFDSGGTTSSGELIKGAVEEAAARGPQALLELFASLKENQLDPRYSSGWKFPAGFDFAALFEGAPKVPLFYAPAWIAQNREQAFDHLVAKGAANNGSIPLEAMFRDLLPGTGAVDVPGCMERATWIAGRLEDLPEEHRVAVAAKMVSGFDTPELLGAFTKGITDEAIRAQTATGAMEKMTAGGVAPTLAYLETAGNPEWRVQVLDALSENHGLAWKLTPVAEGELRAKLAGWNLSPGRTDEIINHFKRER